MLRHLISIVIVSSGGCAPRAGRPLPADEHSSRAVEAVQTPALPDASAPAPAEVPERAPPERLPWVNPARCLTPCAYDPQASLVRVDDQGLAATAGTHLVHRSIQEPLHALVSAARAAGHHLRIESGYRSYDDQVRLFRDTKQVGRAARPGHSEHQLGTAVDLRLPTSAAIGWLAEHSRDHGFALSYPDGKQRITGYRPEPWHVRFVGLELAKELRDNAQTLEELFRARPDLGGSGNCEDCPLATSRPSCGAISEAGTCDGTVLQWCYDDALATVDCAASKQRCGRARSSGVSDCLPAPK